jgi:hypothetical protein
VSRFLVLIKPGKEFRSHTSTPEKVVVSRALCFKPSSQW